MRKLLLGTGIGLVLVVGAVAALPFLIPASTYQSVIEEQLESALQRDVVLATPPKIQFFPQLGAKFEDVTIANAEGFEAEHFVSAESLNIAVKWMPLLSRKIEIASAEFSGTEVFLEEKSNGENNWTFSSGSSSDAPITEDGDTGKGGEFEAVIPRAILTSSRVKFTSAAQDLSYDVTDINLTAKLPGLSKPFNLNGDFTVNEQPFDISATLTSLEAVMNGDSFTMDASVNSDLANFKYDGDITAGETIALNGVFDATLSDVSGLMSFADIETEYDLSDVGELKASGRVSGTPENLSISGLKFNQKSRLLTASYTGDVKLTESAVNLNGSFDANISDLAGVMSLAKIESDIDASALGKISVEGRISGASEDLSISGLSLNQKSDLLTTTFNGDVHVANAIKTTGSLTAKSNKVRELASAFGTELVADDSSAFRSFDIDLGLTQNGAGTDIAIKTLDFDNTSISGSAYADMSGSIPYINADLTIPELDLTPYQNEPTEKKQASDSSGTEWSKDPIDLTGLKSVNADFDVKISALTNDNAKILDLDMSAALKSGRLSGAFSTSEPEGGRPTASNFVNPLQTGDLNATFDIRTVSATDNRLTFTTNGSGIAASEVVEFLTGNEILKGVANLDASMNTNGSSISDFVSNLSGRYNADISNGAIFGVNLAQLVRSAESALKTGQLPTALSPEDQTDFASLTLNGNLNSGTANIDVFELLSPILKVNATGNVDIFNQTIDIQFRPRALNTNDDSGLLGSVSGFGIPLRVYGSWDGIKGSLDTAFLTDLVAQEAKNRVAQEITNRVGGDLGGLLGNVLGGSSSSGSNTSDDTTIEGTETPEEETEEEEIDAEDVAKDLLKGLFGQ